MRETSKLQTRIETYVDGIAKRRSVLDSSKNQRRLLQEPRFLNKFQEKEAWNSVEFMSRLLSVAGV